MKRIDLAGRFRQRIDPVDRSRRRATTLLTGLAAAASGLGAGAVRAQGEAFPSRTIRLVVGYAVGGPTDVLARLLAKDMTQILGQPVVVDNRPGASGRIGTELVAQSPADGYTLTVSTLGHNVNVLLSPGLAKYDPIKDFAPVILTSLLPMVAITSAQSPIRSIAEIVERAKAQPGVVTYGSAGHGGSAHLAAALLEVRSGTKMNHVPFKGNGPAMQEMMAGRIDFMFYPMVGVKPLVDSGRIRALAVTTAKRHPDYPDAPTMAEIGYKGFEDYSQGIGILAPAGTPAAVVDKLNDALNKSLKLPETVAQLSQLGAIVEGGTPKQFGDWLVKDAARWREVISAANVKAE